MLETPGSKHAQISKQMAVAHSLDFSTPNWYKICICLSLYLVIFDLCKFLRINKKKIRKRFNSKRKQIRKNKKRENGYGHPGPNSHWVWLVGQVRHVATVCMAVGPSGVPRVSEGKEMQKNGHSSSLVPAGVWNRVVWVKGCGYYH